MTRCKGPVQSRPFLKAHSPYRVLGGAGRHPWRAVGVRHSLRISRATARARAAVSHIGHLRVPAAVPSHWSAHQPAGRLRRCPRRRRRHLYPPGHLRRVQLLLNQPRSGRVGPRRRQVPAGAVGCHGGADPSGVPPASGTGRVHLVSRRTPRMPGRTICHVADEDHVNRLGAPVPLVAGSGLG